MKVLFVCKYNRFRSKFAEAFFNKMKTDSRWKARSAGVIQGKPVSSHIHAIAREFGVKIKGQPQGLTDELLRWQDVVIIAAEDVPREVFSKNNRYARRIIHWKIKDAQHDERSERMRIIPQIEKKVAEFIAAERKS